MLSLTQSAKQIARYMTSEFTANVFSVEWKQCLIFDVTVQI